MMNVNVLRFWLPAALLSIGISCSTEEKQEVFTTLNAGTHPMLDWVQKSPVRDICDTWYGNDLCTIDGEKLVRNALETEQPDFVMLQEIWRQEWCSNTGRPEASSKPPYVCSIPEGNQVLRILPIGYNFACTTGEKNFRNGMICIAYRPSFFQAKPFANNTGTCNGRDCSSLFHVLDAKCKTPWGSIALLRGESRYGPTVLVAVHLSIGLSSEDQDCQVEQIRVMRKVLAEFPDDFMVVAGDFNLDIDVGLYPRAIEELKILQNEIGLLRLRNDSKTNQMMITPFELDMIFTRGWTKEPKEVCQVRFLNPENEPPLIDHGFVVCRAGNKE